MRKFLKTILSAMAVAAALSSYATLPARALVEIDINQGVVEPLPVAITSFLSATSRIGRSAGIEADLRCSALFAPIDRRLHREDPNPDARPAPDWKVTACARHRTRAQEADGCQSAEFRGGTPSRDSSRRRAVPHIKANWRRVAHIIPTRSTSG